MFDKSNSKNKLTKLTPKTPRKRAFRTRKGKTALEIAQAQYINKPEFAEMIRMMSEHQCTLEHMSLVLKIHESVITSVYGELIALGKATGQAKLLAAMWEKALVEKDTKMQIWLAKQYLGHKDSALIEATQQNFNIQIIDVPK